MNPSRHRTVDQISNHGGARDQMLGGEREAWHTEFNRLFDALGLSGVDVGAILGICDESISLWRHRKSAPRRKKAQGYLDKMREAIEDENS